MAWWENFFAGGANRAKVPANLLKFDDTNPRYTPDKRPANSSDAAIIQYLDRTADLGELIQSIASGGYIDIEPLIVVERAGELVVLEGNRRLAALKVLSSPQVAEETNISVPELTPEVELSLQEVTVFKVAAEEDARELIGFKHINGPQGWDAYAKARYAARWLDEQQGKGSAALTLTDIAARMGDKHDTLFRIVSAVYVLRQAEERDLFSVEDRFQKNFSFSHLYTALTYTEFREFVGLPRAERNVDPPRNPVPDDSLPNLKLLLRWLYGSKAEVVRPAIRTQAQDLSRLKTVLGHPVARRMMMERHDLEEALQLTIEPTDRFEKALVDALASLRVASGELQSARPDAELLAISADALSRAEFIYDHLDRINTRRSGSDGE
jgi:hypothetical protein